MVNNFDLKDTLNNESFTFDSEMLCLTDRKQEFKKASERASKSDLCVFCDAPDRYVVVNAEAKANYGVKLRTSDGRIYADCDCGDFVFRKRVCKHIAAVIDEILFG